MGGKRRQQDRAQANTNTDNLASTPAGEDEDPRIETDTSSDEERQRQGKSDGTMDPIPLVREESHVIAEVGIQEATGSADRVPVSTKVGDSADRLREMDELSIGVESEVIPMSELEALRKDVSAPKRRLTNPKEREGLPVSEERNSLATNETRSILDNTSTPPLLLNHPTKIEAVILNSISSKTLR